MRTPRRRARRNKPRASCSPLPRKRKRGAQKQGEVGGNDRRWKTRKLPEQVSLRFPTPLEIAARFPHPHRPGDDSLCCRYTKTKTRKELQPRHLPPARSGLSFDEKNTAARGCCPTRGGAEPPAQEAKTGFAHSTPPLPFRLTAAAAAGRRSARKYIRRRPSRPEEASRFSMPRPR